MERSQTTAEAILELLKRWSPNEAPIDELTPFEYGVIAGKQILIRQLEAHIDKLNIHQKDK